MDSKEIKPVSPKGNQPRIFIGRTDAEAETPILWPPDAKCQLTGKTLMVGKIKGKRKRGVTENEMVRRHPDSMDLSLSKLRETVKVKEVWRAAVYWVATVGHDSN